MSLSLTFHSQAHAQMLIDKYFNSCHSDGNQDNPQTRVCGYGMAALAYALDIDRITLLRWQEEMYNYVSKYDNLPEYLYNSKDPLDKRLKDGKLPQEEVDAISNTIKKARRKVETYLESRLDATGGNVIGPIFLAKNNFNYADKQEIYSVNENIEKMSVESEEDIKEVEKLLAEKRKQRANAKVVPIRKVENE